MTVFGNQATLLLRFVIHRLQYCIIRQQLSCQELSAGAGVRRRHGLSTAGDAPHELQCAAGRRRRHCRCRRWWYQLDYTVIKMIFRATARNNVFSVSSLLATATVALCAKTKDTAAGCVTSVTTLEQ